MAEHSEGDRFLCVGLVCLDIINICSDFPKEDSDQRVLDQKWQRGGNASNDAAVLNMLQVPCDLLGTLSKAPVVRYIEDDCKELGINIESCVYLERPDFPTSCVLLNSKNGSRTIVHSNKNWAEPTVDDFKKIDLSKYSWIHFEGRNALEVNKMMDIILNWNNSITEPYRRITISVELEKNKVGVEHFYDKVDILFIGKMFAEARGFTSMQETVKTMSSYIKPGSSVICAWGEKGACGMTKETEQLLESGIFPPENGVVDTLGAGDTFLSGTIYSLHKNYDLQSSLVFGCKLAGAKCGIAGWSGLRNICLKYKNMLS